MAAGLDRLGVAGATEPSRTSSRPIAVHLPRLASALLLVALGSGCGVAGAPAAGPAVPSPSPSPSLAACRAAPTPERFVDYVGLSEREAEALAARRRVAVRTVCRDGAGLAVTADFQRDRVSLVVVDGQVLSAHGEPGALPSR